MILTGVFSMVVVEAALGDTVDKLRRFWKWLLVIVSAEIVFSAFNIGINALDAYVKYTIPDIWQRNDIVMAGWAASIILFNMVSVLINTIIPFAGSMWAYRKAKSVKAFTGVLAGLGASLIYEYIYRLFEMPFLKTVPGSEYKIEPPLWLTAFLLALCLFGGCLFYKKRLLAPLKKIMDTPDGRVDSFVKVPVLSSLVFALLLSALGTFGINWRNAYWQGIMQFIVVFGCLIGVYVMMYWAIFRGVMLSTVVMKSQAELGVATNIQASMLPCKFPAFPERTEFDICASMTPAKEVGGDFYDFFLVDSSHLAVVIADVSGKGVPAALFMVIAKTLIKDNTQAGVDPALVFTKVNQQLCETNDEGMFVTAWMGVLEISSGHMFFANAGHNPPLLRRGDGGWEYLKQRSGFVLAGMENMRYQSGELQLSPGDALYLYTDGVTEAVNPTEDLYGETRLRDSLNAAAYETSEQLLAFIKSEVDVFVGEAPQVDDITMLALKLNKGRS